MDSNFSHLADVDRQLVRLGELAGRLFHIDPPSCIGKTRLFAELLAKEVAARAGQLFDAQTTFEELLRRLRDDGLLPRDVSELFHYIRRVGNVAIHENVGTPGDALTALKAAWQLGIWFRRAFLGEPKFRSGPFQPPQPPVDATVELRDEIEKLRKAVRDGETAAERSRREASEAELARASAEERAAREAEDRKAAEDLLDEVEAARRQSERRLAELQIAAAQTPAADLMLFRTTAETAASAVVLDEGDTRRLIDAQLREAGWTADSDNIRHSDGSRPNLADAVAIAEWPTETGPVDYALFLKGRCVGVIEAKRAAKDVPSVLEQAKRYAQTIKLQADEIYPRASYQHSTDKPFRVPLTFATNSRPFVKQLATKSGIWAWDARKETNRPSALPEWFSPRDVEERLQQDAQAAQELAAETFSYAGLRPYQQDAVRAVESAMADGQKDILIAMATGTGKTRTCIALMYRLLKHKMFRRILFLVDRIALGDQTLQALHNTELEGLLKFASTYNVADLDKKLPDKEDRVHVATVQSMVKRILRSDDATERPTPGMYDLIIVDEAHRGYVLDAELREGDIAFRNLEDFLSQYRRVLDYFDATKVALTATPALHTTQIFGPPVYSYGYRQAVIEGYLIDHQPPRRIVTALSKAGIHFQGGEEVQVIDPRTGQIDLFQTPDVVDFEVQEFNKKVHTVEFNRVVAEAVAAEVPPDKPGKTLFFAARDDHADILVDELRKALEAAYGPQPHDLVQKITGSVDDPADKIRRFRNDPHPKYAVTVDLLTTGVDIPEICTLVFVRRVNSRILYDQMIGRATRRADHIGKEIFRIFDAVDIYANLQSVTDMRPIIVDPKITLSGLIQDLGRAGDEEDRVFVCDQIVVKVRQLLRHLSSEAATVLRDMIDIAPEALAAQLRAMSPSNVIKLFADNPRLAPLLEGVSRTGSVDPGIFVSEHGDTLVSVDDVFEGVSSPEDYISAFERFVKENMNLIPALAAAAQKPRDLTRKDLKSLAVMLDQKGFSEAKLRRAYRKARNADIAAHIIGFIRQAAMGDPLVPYAIRVENALDRIKASKAWTTKQRQWLDRIGRALKEQPVSDRTILDEPAFLAKGGFETVDRDFDHGLAPLLQDLNAEIWAKSA
jgi:type I restriction enzyme R subunit